MINKLSRKKIGQSIRELGPQSHYEKSGTPTMGGSVFILAAILAYFGSHLLTSRHITASGILVLGLMAGLGAYGGAGLSNAVNAAGSAEIGKKASEEALKEGLSGEVANQKMQEAMTNASGLDKIMAAAGSPGTTAAAAGGADGTRARVHSQRTRRGVRTDALFHAERPRREPGPFC